MAKKDPYREANRRKHKLLGIYLALWAWEHKVDCVILPREELLPFLDVDTMWNQHIDCLKEDVKYLFPHAWVTEVPKTKKYQTLYLSRLVISEAIKSGTMTDPERFEAIAKGGLKAAIVKIPKESEIVRDLACVTHGIADFAGEVRA